MPSKDLLRIRRLQINKAAAEAANSCNLGADEDDTEGLLKMVPEELTDEELWELEQERLVQEEASEKETAGKEKHPKKIHSEGFSRSFADFISLF